MLALLASASVNAAPPVSVTHPPSGALGAYADVLIEAGTPLAPSDVMARVRSGDFGAGSRPVLNFGIGAPPVWAHWRIENPGTQPVRRRLFVGTPWIDRLEVFILEGDTLVAQWRTGDAVSHRHRPVAGLGFAFDHPFAPGTSDVLLLAATADPLVLPVSLIETEASVPQAEWEHYSQGFVYGYLLALIAYNLVLYAGLRKRSHLLYAIYLATFIALNLAYTGRGYAWLWPDHPGVQRYAILVLMVLFGAAGLQFADRFLDLVRHMPAVRRGVHALCVAGLATIGGAVVAGAQEAAARIAFSFMVAFALTMLALGARATRAGYPAGRYFLAAAIAAMTGTLTTTLAVWGFIPYSAWAFRAVEVGMLFDATLLALALAHRSRLDQEERVRAEHLARTDPLTHLPNRRAFREQAEPIWSTALRSHRNIALIMVDIDDFKRLNDTHGHLRGDEALAAMGQLLLAAARRGDMVARWGGEEFIMLLPETNVGQATVLAERLRLEINLIRLSAPSAELRVTASFGVAQLKAHATLDALIDEADAMLYRAKQLGRNQVFRARESDAVDEAP